MAAHGVRVVPTSRWHRLQCCPEHFFRRCRCLQVERVVSMLSLGRMWWYVHVCVYLPIGFVLYFVWPLGAVSPSASGSSLAAAAAAAHLQRPCQRPRRLQGLRSHRCCHHHCPDWGWSRYAIAPPPPPSRTCTWHDVYPRRANPPVHRARTA